MFNSSDEVNLRLEQHYFFFLGDAIYDIMPRPEYLDDCKVPYTKFVAELMVLAIIRATSNANAVMGECNIFNLFKAYSPYPIEQGDIDILKRNLRRFDILERLVNPVRNIIPDLVAADGLHIECDYAGDGYNLRIVMRYFDE